MTAPRGPWRILFSPVRFGEAAALQEGVCDHCHQRVAVQAMPRAAFEVVEAQFFLELLMRLLADPSRLDRGGERLEVGLCRQVGKIVFALARDAALADQPSLLARHVLHPLLMDALGRTIGDPHAHGGEGGRQRTFGSFAPTDASPLRGGEHVFSRRGKLIGDMALTRPPASGGREHERDVARVDFLQLRDSDRPLEAARIEPLTERRGKAIACIRQHRRKPNASGADAIDLGQRDLWLCTRCAPILRHAGLRHPIGSVSPALRQKQAQADHDRNLVPRQRQRHQRLAIGGLAERRGVLRRHADRMRPLLR